MTNENQAAQVKAQALRAKREREARLEADLLREENRKLAHRVDSHEKTLNEVRNSFSFRLSQHLVTKPKSVTGLLGLPFSVLALAMAERKSRSEKKAQEEKAEREAQANSQAKVAENTAKNIAEETTDETAATQGVSSAAAAKKPTAARPKTLGAKAEYFTLARLAPTMSKREQSGDRLKLHTAPDAWLELGIKGLKKTIHPKGAQRVFFSVTLKPNEPLAEAARSSLAKIIFKAKDGSTLEPMQKLPVGAKFGAYLYLPYEAGKSVVFTLNIPEGCTSVELTFHNWMNANISLSNSINIDRLYAGISVVVPSYKGQDYIETCLQSLVDQTLDRNQFEVILVLNGELDDTIKIAKQVNSDHPDLNLKIVESTKKGASAARNTGINLATRAYITLLDDDDTLTPIFLESVLKRKGDRVMVVTPMVDILDGVEKDSALNTQIHKAAHLKNPVYHDVTSALSTNAGKVISTAIAKSIKFDESLKNGEDVVFWGEVITRFLPGLAILTQGESLNDVAYRRLIRENSISRQKASFDFLVQDRLNVIEGLDKLARSSERLSRDYLYSKVRAQAGFIVRYLRENSDEHPDFIKAFDKADIEFPLKSYVNEQLSDELVISYCFPPYVDTAGVVTVKRICEAGVPVDVISNAMKNTRKTDDRLCKLSEDFVGKSMILATPESFGNWGAIEAFCKQALIQAGRRDSSPRGPYKTLYSRALWPASHFAAAAYKAKNLSTFWRAEFSDPIKKDIHGVDRSGEIRMDWLRETGILDLIKSKGFDLPNTNSMFELCELLPYYIADELVFTNRLQRDYMLGYLNDPKLEAHVRRIGRVSPHPTFTHDYYNMAKSPYELDKDEINIGYFGAFYASRGLGAILSELQNLSAAQRKKIKFHIFTNQKDAVENLPDYELIKDNLIVRDYVAYLEFLNISKSFNLLLVNDTYTLGIKPVNPYLPSKLSDYAGSGRRIWALYETGSALDKLTKNTDILRTDMYNPDEILSALKGLSSAMPLKT